VSSTPEDRYQAALIEAKPLPSSRIAAPISEDLEATPIGSTPGLTTLEQIATRLRKGSTVLVAANMLPMFDKESGALRLYSIVSLIEELGWKIVFLSTKSREQFVKLAGSEDACQAYEKSLLDIGVSEIVYGHDDAERLLQRIGGDLGWAYLYFPRVANQLIPKVRYYAPWAKIIYDMVDFHYLRLRREAELSRESSPEAAAASGNFANRMREVELTCARTADLTVSVSDEERRKLLAFDGSLKVEIIPNVFKIPKRFGRTLAKRSGALFVGGFWHRPNVDAVLWFVNDILPLIHAKDASFRLTVAGSNTPPEIFALGDRAGVDIVGFVTDLTKLLGQNRMSVAPLRYGAGVKGKVGQSLAHGLPVVTTAVGAEGMGLRDGEHVLIADTPEDFAAAVLRLATDDVLWNRLRSNGREVIKSTQSTRAIRSKLEAILNGSLHGA